MSSTSYTLIVGNYGNLGTRIDTDVTSHQDFRQMHYRPKESGLSSTMTLCRGTPASCMAFQHLNRSETTVANCGNTTMAQHMASNFNRHHKPQLEPTQSGELPIPDITQDGIMQPRGMTSPHFPANSLHNNNHHNCNSPILPNNCSPPSFKVA